MKTDNIEECLLHLDHRMLTKDEIKGAHAELAQLLCIKEAARALLEGWNKGGIAGAPDVIEMQRRMLKLAELLDTGTGDEK